MKLVLLSSGSKFMSGLPCVVILAVLTEVLDIDQAAIPLGK